MNGRLEKVLVLLFGTLLVIGLTIIGTVAYLSDKQDAENTLHFGNVLVKLKDANKATGGTILVPGNSKPRTPAVENIGTVPCYVRAEISISNASLGNQQSVQDFISFSRNTTDWDWADFDTLGIIYYRTALAVGEETPAMFAGINLAAMDSGSNPLLEGSNDGFKIIVNVDAVQSDLEGYPFAAPKDAFSQMLP